MLKMAFNALTRFHSRPATLKRLGQPDIYSPVRITPSNYSRYIQGPSQMVVKGREFVLPVDTMTGHSTQLVSFDETPTLGETVWYYDGESSPTVVPFDAVAADVQAALREIEGLENVTVSGDFTVGFTVVFVGVDAPVLLEVTGDIDFDAAITVNNSTGVKWNPVLKRGDKIIDTSFGHMAVEEIEEIVDIGGVVMGYRCRVE